MTDRGYVAKNDEQRARLTAFVRGARDGDLAHAMPGGWTVAAALAHAAFWDERIAVLVERWKTRGVAPSPEGPADVEWINDSMKPALLTLPPRAAAELAVRTAERVDALVESLSDEWVERIVAANVITLVRATHRREHLDQIEEELAR